MKTLIIAIALVLSLNVYAQEVTEKNRVFVRVYDLNGEKFSKGKILSVSDTTLYIKGKQVIEARNIGFIKTRHSGGNNVLIGAASGAAVMGIAGAVAADPDHYIAFSPGQGAALGITTGGVAGAVIGGISILFKNPKTFIIDGDELKWKEFREYVIKK